MWSEKFGSLKKVSGPDDAGGPYDVSYLVRVKNESSYIPDLVDSINSQTYSGRSCCIVLDSGSSDGSISLFAELECDLYVYTIEPSEFVFGDTCNLLMEISNSRYCFFLSGHVILGDVLVVEKSISALENNDNCAAVALRQVPHHVIGASPYEKLYLRKSFPDFSVEFIDVQKGGALSNAGCVIRKSCWCSIPYDSVCASEDQLWCAKVISFGFCVLYAPQLKIEHSHNESPNKVFSRVRINKVARFGESPQPFRAFMYFAVISAVFAVRGELRSGWRYALAHSYAYWSSDAPAAISSN